MYVNKAKLICTVIRPSLKILKVNLHRNKDNLENLKVDLHRIKANLKNLKID